MNKFLKKVGIVFLLVSTFGCGFKIVDKSKENDFTIQEIQTSGDKRINFKLKNNLQISTSNQGQEIILINIATKKIKNIAERNIKKEISKYQVIITSNVNVQDLTNKRDFKFTVSTSADYMVEPNYSSTLTNEKNVIDYLVDVLAEKILNNINLQINDFKKLQS